MRSVPLPARVLSGLNMMAELSEAWRAADEDESLNTRQIASLEAADRWLRSLTPRARATGQEGGQS